MERNYFDDLAYSTRYNSDLQPVAQGKFYNDAQIDEKLKITSSYGFMYDPFQEIFINPFTGRKLMNNIVQFSYDLTVFENSISELDNKSLVKQNIISKGALEALRIEAVNFRLFHYPILKIFPYYQAIVGILLVILYFVFSNYNFIIFPLVSSYIFSTINLERYYSDTLSFEFKNLDPYKFSPRLYDKYANLFGLLAVISLIISLYSITIFNEHYIINFIIGIIFIFILLYIVNNRVQIFLGKCIFALNVEYGMDISETLKQYLYKRKINY
jgi:hypothetical protein